MVYSYFIFYLPPFHSINFICTLFTGSLLILSCILRMQERSSSRNSMMATSLGCSSLYDNGSPTKPLALYSHHASLTNPSHVLGVHPSGGNAQNGIDHSVVLLVCQRRGVEVIFTEYTNASLFVWSVSDDEEEQCEPQERASWQCLLGEDLSEEEDSSPSEDQDQEQDEGRLQDDWLLREKKYTIKTINT